MAVAECGIRESLAKILRSKKRPRPTLRSGRGSRTNSNTSHQIPATSDTGKDEKRTFEPKIVSLLFVLRALIEGAPQSERGGKREVSKLNPCSLWLSHVDGGSRGTIALAARHRLPAVYAFRQFVAAGGLVSYGIDQVDVWRRAALYVDRVLRRRQIPPTFRFRRRPGTKRPSISR